jgi:hypothetical protein
MLATLPEAQMLTCRERLQIEPLTNTPSLTSSARRRK